MSRASQFGDRAVLISCDDRAERLAVRSRLIAEAPGWSIREGICSLLVVAERPDARMLAAVDEVLDEAAPPTTPDEGMTSAVTIAVVYDGADLDETAEVLGLSKSGLVRAHTAQSWVVDVMGFAPGFGYLIPIEEETAPWSSANRRASPREQVPAGSVAVAAGMSAVYPAAMPGGWNLLGRTSAVMFDVADESAPSLLAPGARVRFVEQVE